MKPQDIVAGKASSLWIFGYGSLVWKPDFEYRRSHVGSIRGYKRRFWHGDNFHRGDDELVSCEHVLFVLLLPLLFTHGARFALNSGVVSIYFPPLCSPEEW